ncbi:hypothetical protein P4S81_04335 [Pseudoalteromonas sp. B28]
MKASNTQLALAVAAALASTSVLANDDTQKLQEQLDALQKEVSALKTTSGFNLEFGGRVQLDYNYFDGAYNADNEGSGGSDFFLVVFVLTLKVSTEIGITSYYSNLLKALLK